MTIFVVSAFRPDVDSGAAGTIDAISRAWERQGHEVRVAWRDRPPGVRAVDEFVRTPAELHRQIQAHLHRYPNTDVVVASQPYAARAFQALRPAYPNTLFVNRTHGWEDRGIASQAKHDWEPHPSWSHRLLRRPARYARRQLCRRVATAAHGVVAACRHDADYIRDRYDLPDWRVAAIPYGIDRDTLPMPRARPTGGPVRFVFAGTYCERKGSAVLERVLPGLPASHPDCRLTFVVNADAVGRVERAFRPAWGHRLAVHPWVARHDLFDLFADHDVLLFPSFFEGFGKVVIEALAMGCAVAGFDEGALGDLRSPCCLTRPVGDVAGFDRLVRDIAGRKLDLRSLSVQATRVGRERSWDHTAAETIEFVRQLRDRYRGGTGTFTRVPAAAI